MINLNHVRLSDMHRAANANACCPGSACKFPSNRCEKQEHIDVSPPAEAAGNFLKLFEAAASIERQADDPVVLKGRRLPRWHMIQNVSLVCCQESQSSRNAFDRRSVFRTIEFCPQEASRETVLFLPRPSRQTDSD